MQSSQTKVRRLLKQYTVDIGNRSWNCYLMWYETLTSYWKFTQRCNTLSTVDENNFKFFIMQLLNSNKCDYDSNIDAKLMWSSISIDYIDCMLLCLVLEIVFTWINVVLLNTLGIFCAWLNITKCICETKIWINYIYIDILPKVVTRYNLL